MPQTSDLTWITGKLFWRTQFNIGQNQVIDTKRPKLEPTSSSIIVQPKLVDKVGKESDSTIFNDDQLDALPSLD